MAFTGVSRECMKILNPLVISAMNRVGVPTRRPYDNYWDGYHNKNIFDKSGGKIDNNQAQDSSGEESIGDQTAQAATSRFRAQITNSPFGAVCVNTSSATLPPRSQQTSHVSTKSSSITRILRPLQGPLHYPLPTARQPWQMLLLDAMGYIAVFALNFSLLQLQRPRNRNIRTNDATGLSRHFPPARQP
jgi:hypothetical protein